MPETTKVSGDPARGAGRPFWHYPLYGVLAVFLIVNVALYIRNPNDLDRFLINAMLGLSVFVTLDAGLLSLANAGFMAIGAYGSAILVVKAGLPLPLAMLGAMAICGLVALVVGLPVLRLRDVYLAIATIGFGEVVRILIVTNPELTGGATGANLSTGFPYEKMRLTQTWMLVLALLVLVWCFYWLSRSRTGRAFRAIRANPQAAETMGIDVVSYRNLAFVLSAVVAGLAGSLYAHEVGSLDNNDFQFSRAVQILSYAVLGGSTHWFGPILGAGLLTGLPVFLREFAGSSIPFFRDFAQLPNIINGLALMLIIIFLPAGLYSPARRRSVGVRVPAPKSSVTRPSASEGREARSEAIAESASVPPPNRGARASSPVPGKLTGEGGSLPATPAGETPALPAGAGEAWRERAEGQDPRAARPPRPQSSAPSSPLLELRDVRCVFGGVKAVDGVDLSVSPGEVYGLIGPNGAGKTTLINLISGLYRPTGGQILFKGTDISRLPAYRIAQLGVARSYQNIRLFGEMSVLENVIVGRHAHIRTNPLTTWLRLSRERREEKEAAEAAVGLLERLGLSQVADTPARALSYGDQRRVEIARALAAEPSLLLLDEPAAGLTAGESASLADFLLELKRHGYTILVIEHHMDLIMSVSDRIMVLNFGRSIADGNPAQVRQDPHVVEAYLGHE